ncbi:MAG TPA: phage holin family protein [Chitinophagaceae bacterium]|nr:phage holin family protein [Chitinophagaceae bacterium]
MTILLLTFTGISAVIEQLFGMNVIGFIAFVLVMPTEVISGVKASGESFSSKRFSRFLFKLFYYMVLIFVSHAMADSYKAHDKVVIAALFEWVNTVLVIHITSENIISILENVATIEGKEKSFYINLIRKRFKSFVSDGNK